MFPSLVLVEPSSVAIDIILFVDYLTCVTQPDFYSIHFTQPLITVGVCSYRCMQSLLAVIVNSLGCDRAWKVLVAMIYCGHPDGHYLFNIKYCFNMLAFKIPRTHTEFQGASRSPACLVCLSKFRHHRSGGSYTLNLKKRFIILCVGNGIF